MTRFLSIIFLMLGVIIIGQALPSIARTKTVTSVAEGQDASQLCPIHREIMVSGSVPVRFGRVAMYEFEDSAEPQRGKIVGEYLRAKKEYFAETHRWVNGGCSPSFWYGKVSVTLYYCETCRRHEDEWFDKHPDFSKKDRLP